MFKVNDKVKWMGVEGVVIGIGVADETYPIWVSFKNGKDGRFTRDGKQLVWHKEPSLVLVERAEKFEEVVGHRCVYKHSGDVCIASVIDDTIEAAMNRTDHSIGYQEVKYFRKVE